MFSSLALMVPFLTKVSGDWGVGAFAENAAARPSLESVIMLCAGLFLLRLATRDENGNEPRTAFDKHFFVRLASEKLDFRIIIGGALVMLAPLRLLAPWLH